MSGEAWRDEFPIQKRWAFLNHAAVAPLPRRTRDAVVAWADDMLANGGANNSHWWQRVEEIRGLAARLIGAKAAEVAFIPNTSAGLSYIAEGFPWNPGDNVVIAQGEYPSNVYPWLHLERRGVETRILPLIGGRITPRQVADAIDSRTRLFSVSFVQYSTGFRCDLAAMVECCHASGVDVCVDAIQGLGAIPLDVSALGIDYLVADGHKWLLGPEGAGIFFIRQELLEKIQPTSVGWKSVVGADDFSTIDFRLKPSAARFEPGTFSTGGIVALGASLELLAEVTIADISERVLALTGELIRRLERAGAEIHSPLGNQERSGIVSFALPGTSPTAFARACRDRGVILAVRDGRLRASPHFYNQIHEIERLLEILP